MRKDEKIIKTHHSYILGQLVPFFAHEINNFITTISGYSQMALTLKKEDVIMKSIEQNEEICKKIRNFTSNIFILAERDIFKKSPIRLKNILTFIDELYGYHLKKRNILLETTSTENSFLTCNKTLLNLFLFTLILDSEERFLKKEEEGKTEIFTEEKEIIYRDSSSEKSQFLEFNSEEIPTQEPELGWYALEKIAEIHKWHIEKKYTNGNEIKIKI